MSQLAVEINLLRNPWEEVIDQTTLLDELRHAVSNRADDIERGFHMKLYPKTSMGFVILDPSAPNWKPSDLDIVLATIAIGPDGPEFVANAAAKAFEHRDHGVECGVMVYTQKHRLASGDFRYGFSVCLDGTYVGGSGLTEIQDRFQCYALAAHFNFSVQTLIGVWEKEMGPDRWYNPSNKPGTRYKDIWTGSRERAIAHVGH